MLITCIFCDHKADSLAALREHSATCPEHPAVKENQFYRECSSEMGLAYEQVRGYSIKVMDQQKEIAALRAELAQTPPTLEWLRETLGEPTRTHGVSTEWQGADDSYWVMHQSGGHVSVLNHAEKRFEPATTRAAVLAAVEEKTA